MFVSPETVFLIYLVKSRCFPLHPPQGLMSGDDKKEKDDKYYTEQNKFFQEVVSWVPDSSEAQYVVEAVVRTPGPSATTS